MLREVCFSVEVIEDNSIFALAIGALPDELHTWFTTRVLTVGNGDREVAVSRLELSQLIESSNTWIAISRKKEVEELYEVEALEKTVLILQEFGKLSNLYLITFSNCEGALEND